MKELRDTTFRNVYLREKVKAFLGVDPTAIDFIDEGVMNYVYRVTTKKGTIFFKQGLPVAKMAKDIGKDLASITPQRIYCNNNLN